jgi:hypothetical protein
VLIRWLFVCYKALKFKNLYKQHADGFEVVQAWKCRWSPGMVVGSVRVHPPWFNNSKGSDKKVFNNDRGSFTITIPRSAGTLRSGPAHSNGPRLLTVVALVCKHIPFNPRCLPVPLGMCGL